MGKVLRVFLDAFGKECTQLFQDLTAEKKKVEKKIEKEPPPPVAHISTPVISKVIRSRIMYAKIFGQKLHLELHVFEILCSKTLFLGQKHIFCNDYQDFYS